MTTRGGIVRVGGILGALFVAYSAEKASDVSSSSGMRSSTALGRKYALGGSGRRGSTAGVLPGRAASWLTRQSLVSASAARTRSLIPSLVSTKREGSGGVTPLSTSNFSLRATAESLLAGTGRTVAACIGSLRRAKARALTCQLRSTSAQLGQASSLHEIQRSRQHHDCEARALRVGA